MCILVDYCPHVVEEHYLKYHTTETTNQNLYFLFILSVTFSNLVKLAL
jgi:hypothetical protein